MSNVMTGLNSIYRKFIRHSVFVVAIIFYPVVVQSEEIVLANDWSPYCPFIACEQGKDGFVIDIAKAIYGAEGYTVVIKNVPWNRALTMVNGGSANGILGVVKKSSPELIYPKIEVAFYRPVVFALNTNPWRYGGIDSLKAVRLGLIQNYGYAEGYPELEKYLKSKSAKVDWIATNESLLHLFMMIEAGHIDATIEDMAVGNYVLQKSGKTNLFKVAGELEYGVTPAYIAFTPKDQRSQHLADIFDEGIVKLRKSGEMKKILAAYGLTDWKK
jgi:polar amino acid transport system substrate-binding protein